ncbi:MAG: hypothetical protein AMJ75_07010 [Phycisphaerae bacterium SM1_79]|nr:MAG: hypothetical protein AMJ75_07010 [Phycisphaerae bacterium SM1_79]
MDLNIRRRTNFSQKLVRHTDIAAQACICSFTAHFDRTATNSWLLFYKINPHTGLVEVMSHSCSSDTRP